MSQLLLCSKLTTRARATESYAAAARQLSSTKRANLGSAVLLNARGADARPMHKELAVAGRQAKVITPGMLRRMLRYVRRSRYPRRNRVIVLLGVKAGLRACEIAGLEWSMALDGQGSIGWSLNVWDAIAKKRSGRRIPIHPQLRRALIEPQ